LHPEHPPIFLVLSLIKSLDIEDVDTNNSEVQPIAIVGMRRILARTVAAGGPNPPDWSS
jgi:hypothetical protein